MTTYVLPYLMLIVLVYFGTVHWVFPRILWIAKTKGLVDLPDYRKMQEKAVTVIISARIMLYTGCIDDIVAAILELVPRLEPTLTDSKNLWITALKINN